MVYISMSLDHNKTNLAPPLVTSAACVPKHVCIAQYTDRTRRSVQVLPSVLVRL